MSVLERIWANVEFYQLIKGYPGAAVIFSIRGEILEVNDHFAALLQCGEGDLHGKKYFDICSSDSNAKEAKILKEQAFVDGYTPLYQKKYELNGQSVTVNQSTYYIKDGASKPLCLLGLISPEPVEGEDPDAQALITRLKSENAQLQDKLTKAAEPQKAETSVDDLETQLAEAMEKIATLERTIVIKDKALELKDTAIQNAETERQNVIEQLQEAQGALAVAMIVEEQEEPETEFSPAGAFPEEENTSEESETKKPEEEDAPIEPLPWESDDVVQDDDEALPSESDPLNPDTDAPWESDDVVFDEASQTETDVSAEEAALDEETTSGEKSSNEEESNEKAG